jgi:hypothetical protein
MVGEAEVVKQDGTDKNMVGMKVEVSIKGESVVVDYESIVRRGSWCSGEARSQKTNARDGGGLAMMDVFGGIFVGSLEFHA